MSGLQRIRLRASHHLGAAEERVGSTILDLGTYRTGEGDLVHAWFDADGTLRAEREGPKGWTSVDPSVITGAVKLSDDPFWPEGERPAQGVLGVDS